MNKRCVLVVGGAGFIGSFLCKRLLELGYRVIAYDNLMRGKRSNVSNIANNPNFSLIVSDANDFKILTNTIIDNKIDYIFHLAANSDIQASAEDPQIEFESTSKTTWSILLAMRETGVKHLFFASTSAVYGELINDKPFKEDDCLNPISYYGSAKMASEAYIRAFSYMNGFNSLIFRFPNVIGPNLTHGVFFDFISRLKENPKQLTVLGDGTQCKPYMHVKDLVDAILLLCWDNKGVNTYNVGVETATYVRTIAEMVVSEMNLEGCSIVYGTSNVGWKGDVPKFAYCLDKIHSTGWKASMTSDEAALETIKEALK
ncbi:MAG: NAD-dependent epimerase/dehydratase family protein [Bacilli bacterium]|nr:NAD-dependent epimerase/dehydratase family protein [Bacilli bacterium]